MSALFRDAFDISVFPIAHTDLPFLQLRHNGPLSLSLPVL